MSLAVTEEAFNASGYVAATNTTAENLSNATVSLSMQVVASTLTDNDNVSATTFTGELGFTVLPLSQTRATLKTTQFRPCFHLTFYLKLATKASALAYRLLHLVTLLLRIPMILALASQRPTSHRG